MNVDAGANGTVLDGFAEQVARRPDAIAVRLGEVCLTYGELDAASSAVARGLAARGIGRENRVGLVAERSIASIVALLGILKAGAAYVPLDPSSSGERQTFIVNDAGLCCLVGNDVEEKNSAWVGTGCRYVSLAA